MRMLALLATAVVVHVAFSCTPSDIHECLSSLSYKDGTTLDMTMLETVFRSANSESKILTICEKYEAAFPCLEDKMRYCGDDGERSQLYKAQRLHTFICDETAEKHRIALQRSSSCIQKIFSTHLPSTCPISNTPYAEKMSICKAKCAMYDYECRSKIEMSHRSICVVERIKNNCGFSSAAIYVQLQQEMLLNDFPIQCETSVRSTPPPNRIDQAIKQAYWQRKRKSATKKYIIPVTLPTRRKTEQTKPMVKSGGVTVMWNKLLYTSSTATQQTRTPTVEATKRNNRRTTRSAESQEIETTTTELIPIPAPTTYNPLRRVEVDDILGPTPRKSLAWKAIHWLSGARPIPDSILHIFQLPMNLVAPGSVDGAGHHVVGRKGTPEYRVSREEKEGPPQSIRHVIKKYEESEEEEPRPAEGVPLNLTKISEMTDQYITNAVFKLKTKKEKERRELRNSIDRLLRIITPILSTISDSAYTRVRNGLERFKSILT